MENKEQTTLLKIPVAATKFSYRQIAATLLNPLEKLSAIAKRYGGIVQIRIMHKKFIVVEDPVFVRCILQEQYKNFGKYDLSGLFIKLLGNGLITSNGQVWLHQRRLIQPAFHKQQLEHMLGIIQNEIQKKIEELKKEGNCIIVNASRLFMELTFAMITRMLFGETAREEIKLITEIMSELSEESERQVTRIPKLPLVIPSAGNLRFKRLRKKFDSLLYAIIIKRKKQIAEGTVVQYDVLQMLLTSVSEESGSVISDKQIRDELTTLFMAGYQTSSETLGWLFYRVSHQPAITVSVREEMNKCSDKKMFTIQDIAGMNYIISLIKETMRFYPSVWLIVRKNIFKAVVGQYCVPKKSIVLINVFGIHHNLTYWEKPDEFRADRFIAQGVKEQHAFSYLPFGAGPRLCIGQPFAMMMMQVIVSRLLADFDCKPAGNLEITMEPQVTLKPKQEIYVQLTPVCKLN